MGHDLDPGATADAAEVSRSGRAVGADATVPAGVGAPLLPVDRVLAGRYRIVRFLGQGGAGTVYEAVDLRLGTAVALKLLHRGADDARHIDRLRRELLLARKVSHPAVCRVFDLEHDGELWFLTMELLIGESLRDRLHRRGRLPLAEVASLAAALLAGLEVAHAAGVIHRDLTPANVLIVGERVVITDFGLAVEGDEVAPHLRTAGTPAYMAPEQIEGRVPTPATDVFSLGVVLFEAVTGELPWRGRTAYETAALRLTQPAPRARRVVPDVPATWSHALARALAREPARRFADAPAMRAALLEPPRRSNLAVGLVGLALLGAVAVAVALGTSGRRARRPAPPVRSDERGPVRLAFAVGGGSAMVEGVTELPGGDVLLVGHTFAPFAPRGVPLEGCRAGRRCGFVIRLSSAAELRWARVLGGDADIRCHGPALAGDRVVIGGQLGGAAGFAGEADGAVGDGFVMALDLDHGHTVWFRRLGAPGAHVRGVAVDGDGGVYASGDVLASVRWQDGWRPAPGARDAATGFLTAFDRDGVPRWGRWVGGHGHARFFAVGVMGDLVVWAGGVGGDLSGPDVAQAHDGSRALVLALDRRDGALRWRRDVTSPHTVHVTSLAVASDGTAALAGWFVREVQLGDRTASSTGDADGWVARLELATGAPRWVTPVGGEGWDNLVSVAVTSRGVWAAGRSSGFRAGDVVAQAAGETDALYVALAPEGQLRRAWMFGGRAADKGRVVAPGRSGVWLTGNFRHAMRAGAFQLGGDGINDGFVVRLAPSEAP